MIGARLKLAREILGGTQTELAGNHWNYAVRSRVNGGGGISAIFGIPGTLRSPLRPASPPHFLKMTP